MKILGLFVTLLMVGTAHAADLKFGGGTHDNSVMLVNSTTKSCYLKTDTANPTAPDNVAAKYFSISNFFVQWTNPNLDLRIVALRVDLQNANFPGSIYTMMLSGDEITSLDGSHGKWPAILPRSSRGYVFNSSCAPVFGSVAVLNDVDFRATGTMTMFAFTRDSYGNERPYQVSAPLTVYNMAPAPAPAQ